MGGSSLLKSLGAGMAGGFLGSMLFRSLGGGGYGGGAFPGHGGVGMLEILLIGGLLFLLYRLFANRAQAASHTSSGASMSMPTESPSESSPDGSSNAGRLLRQARPFGWSKENDDRGPFSNPVSIQQGSNSAIPKDLAMDLFFQVQSAWKNRNLDPIANSIDSDARSFIDRELSQLKASRRINCLENIAIRESDVVESWEESDRTYSTVHFTANLLDYTIDEDTHRVVEGSKEVPVKFDEFWTFSKDTYSSQWKLSAIQQM